MSDVGAIAWEEYATPTGPARIYGCLACASQLNVLCTEQGFTDAAAWIALHGGNCGEKKLRAACDDFVRVVLEPICLPVLRWLSARVTR